MDASNSAFHHAVTPFMSDAERSASLAASLANWNGRDPLWVFAYGSLIWRPEFDYDAKHCGVLYGFHRSLCLWSRVYRGTPEKPGLVLGLEPGGCCRGVVFRIPGAEVKREFDNLWQREMTTGSYIPRWVDVHVTRQGRRERVAALAFAMDRRATGYAGELDRTSLLDILRTARGSRGSSAEYLLSTVQCLKDHGISDQHLAKLADEVGIALFNAHNLAV
jgi:glutathione-specific gamma-glutamylcyclotransferase